MLTYALAGLAGAVLALGGQKAARVVRLRGSGAAEKVEYATARDVHALYAMVESAKARAMTLEDRLNTQCEKVRTDLDAAVFTAKHELTERIVQEVAHEADERNKVATGFGTWMAQQDQQGGLITRAEVSIALEQLHNHHQGQLQSLANSMAAVVDQLARQVPAPPMEVLRNPEPSPEWLRNNVVMAPPVEPLFPEGTPTVPLRRVNQVQAGAQAGSPLDTAGLLAGLQALREATGAAQ